MTCSVVKHLGSGQSTQEVGKTLDYVSCFPYTYFVLYMLPACLTTEQITVEASLFVKYWNYFSKLQLTGSWINSMFKVIYLERLANDVFS